MIDNDMPAVAESVAAQGDSGSRRVRHPEWCHIGRCTATPACAMGEAHHSEPVSVTVAGVYPVTVTMSLYRANAPWLTEVFVDVGVSGAPRWLEWVTPLRGLSVACPGPQCCHGE
jgi:hypothetical protein